MKNIFTTTMPTGPAAYSFPPVLTRPKRVESIDLLRGIVMIIMALDHVRDYFHYDAFFYSPTDLTQTTVPLFFTRWITHFCAPVFIFLAGMSAYLHGLKKSKKELSVYLLTRGVWLILVEFFIVGLFRTFNPNYHYFNLQVIGAIGICMIALSVLIYLRFYVVLAISVLMITTHNLLDGVHVQGQGPFAFLWSLIHDPNRFSFGNVTMFVRYPVLPWIGVMALGFCMGRLYDPEFDPANRRKMLFFTGSAMIILFLGLRAGNFYGDSAQWSTQKNLVFGALSFINVTKYPPSLLYILMTIGPALVFLSFSERSLSGFEKRIVDLGKAALFFYLAHVLFIHLFALIGAVISGYDVGNMILSSAVNDAPQLKGYGFDLLTVYIVWIGLIVILFPLCTAYAQYKKLHQADHRWLSYL